MEARQDPIAKIAWEKPKVVAAGHKEENKPTARSGHTMTVVGTNAYMFGGLDGRRPPGPNNELFLLKLGSLQSEWSRIKSQEEGPTPRWKHTATLYDPTSILFFGGFASSSARLNDVWVFNTISCEWYQPVQQGPSAVDGMHPQTNDWPGLPCPRGGHASCLIDKNVYIFGGYGGFGYGRRELDDLNVLNTETWKWSRLTPKGKGPERRSGHSMVTVENSLYIFGGWNSTTQFQDLFVLDMQLDPPTWAGVDQALSFPRWDQASCSVMAIPSWKVFVFGGTGGPLGDNNKQGIPLNDIAVLDTMENSWTYPEVSGEGPSPRAGLQLEYDSKGSKLLVFGGWASGWYDDIYTLDVSRVVGPPYAIMDIFPSMGAITGGTFVEITGIDFVNTADVVVRFASKISKLKTDVKGEFVNQTTVTCVTPDATSMPPGEVDVRVALNGDSFTTTFQKFSFFAVTNAAKCLMYGPGLLQGGAVGEETLFIVQARDSSNINRTTGGDEFKVTIKMLGGGEDGEDVYLRNGVHIQDMEDGSYVVTYTAPQPGDYVVEVQFMGTFGGEGGPVRGSPCQPVFEEFVPRDNNSMGGKIVMNAVRKDLKYLLDFATKSAEGLKARLRDDDRSEEEMVNVIVSVKEHLNLVEEQKEEVDMLADRTAAILNYLKSQGVNVNPMLTQLNKGKTAWMDVLKDVPSVNTKINPLIKSHGTKMKGEIQSYEMGVLAYAEEVNQSAFREYETGSGAAIELIEAMKETHEREVKRCEEKLHLANMFECPRDMQTSQQVIGAVGEMLGQYELLWKCAEESQMYTEEACEMLWVDINPGGLEENAKMLVQKIKKLPKVVKESDAYVGLERTAKDFYNTCPLIGSLRSPAMRDRHWQELMDVTQKEFTLPDKDPSFRLRDILDLKLHEFTSQVEEITEKAGREAKHEETLANLETTWSSIVFVMTLYKDTDVPLLRMQDEDVENLEADQLTLQGMVTSRYVHFRAKSQKWQDALASVSDCNTLLGDMTRMWSYLEPLFMGSDEVKRELPEDTQRFVSIDRQVKQILRSAWKIQKVKEAFTQGGLLARLEALQSDQEQCKKSLTDFLDGKRRVFPRFYFTSEADLLDILSNGSRPEKIMKHIDKVLLATKELTLEMAGPGQRPRAGYFIASVGVETVGFEPAVALEGKVEVYLQTVLSAQHTALKKTLKRSVERYPSQSRPEWLMNKSMQRPTDPAQVAILVAGIQTVVDVEKAMERIANGDAHAMPSFQDRQINDLKDLIKMTQQDLSKADRQRVMCMITLDAHTRDIITKLIREKAEFPTAFQWQSQLKQRYEDDDVSGGGVSEISICDARFDYGFEYLGNGPRLVVTPLTDRIYVTATQALWLKMGCAPAGPAGTGKTESTKDLSSALGKCCYVFNCSPEYDYQSLGNIFKGLASSGSWGCFDEFNRLVPEVLSVCTVQFKAVCDGNKQFDPDEPKTWLVKVEGDQVKLDPTCGAFITMNPGYLGRSALPEGLKALFRPMTVMVPDLVLICENLLMAEGYVDASILASKFYGLYALLRELLSKCEHYDWGLRAVKSVLVVAGALKRNQPDLAEDILLMRALRDFNIPKIVAADEVIFRGLLNDLFPGLNPETVVDMKLSEAVDRACEDAGLWPDGQFNRKCTQLQELVDIRHCVFIMGPAGAGKTTVWKMLQNAQAILDPNAKIKAVDLNPKVVPTEDLYGHISMATREWKDGLLSIIMRDLGNIPDTKMKWIVLDGDLDANWIESMNSVMDDNKMLTLASNERIPLKAHMRMIFEIRDLKYATPATVSRAGILYISVDSGYQWRAIIASWVGTRDDGVYSDEAKENISKCFEEYVPEALNFLKKTVKGVVPLEEVTLVVTLLRMLDRVLVPDNINNAFKLQTAFVFCAIWAFGSALSISDDGADNKTLFSDWWRSQFKSVRLPTRDTVFDYWLDPSTNKFEAWKASPVFKTVEFDSRTMAMSSVTVPTTETAAITYWLEHMVKLGKPCMLAGPAGTGKTQLVNGVLRTLNPEEHLFSTININFYTSSMALLGALEGPLQKRTGSTFGPPGAAKMIYFVDDLNLPEVDVYNTQSAIALIRQHSDYGHWYDMVKMAPKTIADCQYVACMNPTAGSFSINPRLQRHFTTLAIGMPTATSLLTIYQTFLDGHLLNNKFISTVCSLSSAMIKGALALHTEVSESFRKTAANFHYEFNIRHLANVFQGLLTSAPSIFDTPDKFVCLWLHESQRVYSDRLVNTTDVAKFQTILQNHSKKAFPQYNVSRYFLPVSAGGEHLLVCNFMDPLADDPVFAQVDDIGEIQKVLDTSLEEYNESHPVMDLVLFDDAIMHVCRVTRIISQGGGHALMVGVGGSGKQSLSRLGAHMCGYSTQKITISSTYGINDLKTDLQTMYFKAGVKQDGVLFLFTDNQITDERFLVYINDLLSSGNIPDLYSQDEKDNIANMVLPKAKSAGVSQEPKSLWEYFISQVRHNLHMALCFSPVGPDFRIRARKFPALVNSTVIDWFQPWPEEALQTVGERFLTQAEFSSPVIRNAVERFMPMSFNSVLDMSAKFKANEGRHVHSTPKSYLELLKLYTRMLKDKREENELASSRLSNGVQKLLEASESVKTLQVKLESMLEAAEEKRIKSEEIAERVKSEKDIVEVETAKANEEAAKVAVFQEEVSAKAADATNDLAAAEPAITAAMGALDSLDKRDLGNCKTMTTPPKGVGDVFAAVCVLLANVMEAVPVQKNGKVKEKDRSWEATRKILLGNINAFVDDLKEFKSKIDEGGVPDVNFKEVRTYLALEYFTEEAIAKKNSAAAGLCAWVINIVKYYDIWRDVEPKRMKVAEANKQLKKATDELAIVQKKVADMEETLGKLTAEFNKAEADKAEAMDTAERGKTKLDLAQRLINALGSENDRWAAGIILLEDARVLLDGDVLLASAFISYIGPFTKDYRIQLVNDVWIPYMATAAAGASIPMTENSNPIDTLANESQIAEWNTQGLPADPVSAENGAIVCRSDRWPLIVDPQLQGTAWIKKMESGTDRHLQILRLGSNDLLPNLETAIDNGWSVLIENIGERIDAVLGPLIARATVKRGGSLYLPLGENEVSYHKDFRLFLHTKLSNPHYPPEIQAEVTIVNFTVTPKGLEDQLLALVVRKERSDLASKKAALIQQANQFMIQIKRLEDDILMKLSSAEGDITENIALIEGLEDAKRQTVEADAKLEEGKLTAVSVNETSEKYRSVARQGALLFFIMNSLHKMHTYYIYSLNAFVVIFQHGIELVQQAEEKKKTSGRKISMLSKLKKAAHKVIETQRFDWNKDLLHAHSHADENDLMAMAKMAKSKAEAEEKDHMSPEQYAERCGLLKDSITDVLYNYVRRGLFEKDKLTVASLLAFSILEDKGQLNSLVLRTMLADRSNSDPMPMSEEVSAWLPEDQWKRIKCLEDDLFEAVPAFQDFGEKISNDAEDWMNFYNHEAPETMEIPSSEMKGLTELEKMVVLRALRPDRLTFALKKFIKETMGETFVTQPPYNMRSTYMETSASTPIFFVLFPGVDPTPWVEELALSFDVSAERGNFVNISMGQGQEKPAEDTLERMSEQGGWVMLQNVHLMQSWLPTFERKLELCSETANPSFRCFISAEPPSMSHMRNVPEALLQACIKVANEAPADLKSNMRRSWDTFSQARIDESATPPVFAGCLFALCFFHSVLLGRKKFGQQGWSRSYGFNTGDLEICANVLQSYLDTASEAEFGVPWQDLRYIFGEIMYGGHITDFWDRCTCNTYLDVMFNEGITKGEPIAPKFVLPLPGEMDFGGYQGFLESALPAEAPPALLGLHPNAEIGYLTSSTNDLCSVVLRLQAGSSQAAAGGGSKARDVLEDLSKRVPKAYEMITLGERAGELKESEQIPYVLLAVQECGRMSLLMNEIRRTLDDLRKGMNGQLNMSQWMEDLAEALGFNQVPGRNAFHQCSWEKLAWPSVKPLATWFIDLLARVDCLNVWSTSLVLPYSTWMPGLFNPTAFLTAVMQVTARKKNMPLDNMTTATHISTLQAPSAATDYPEDGAYVHGLFIQGARWTDPIESDEFKENVSGTVCAGVVTDAKLKELLPEMPVIYVKAVATLPEWDPTSVGYLRPDADNYNCPVYTTSFRGPTYVFLATLKTKEPSWKWTLAGVALIMSSDN